MFELWEVNNAAFSDSLNHHDAAACVMFSDRVYLCLKGLFVVIANGLFSTLCSDLKFLPLLLNHNWPVV